MKSLDTFIKMHYSNPNYQRLGQKFVNLYIKHPWPELFYATDNNAIVLIEEWLYNNQYYDELPTPVR